VFQGLERLLAGRTTFVISHRLSTIEKADIIFVLDEGRIVERLLGTEEARSLPLHGHPRRVD